MTFRENLPNLSEILENKEAWVRVFFSCVFVGGGGVLVKLHMHPMGLEPTTSPSIPY